MGGTWWYFIQPVPLTMQIDYVGGTNAVYVGEAAPSTSVNASGWRIKYITYDANGNTLSVTWSPNYSKFGDIWANRASLVYS